MLFTSQEFILIFLPIILFVYFVILRWTRTGQNVFLTFASLFFYAWGEPSFLFVMLISIFMNWFFALLVDQFRQRRIVIKLVLWVMVLCNLGIIAAFKYSNFLLDTTNSILESDYYLPKILLPLGISFFTFQAISYVIDVYREQGKAQKNPLNVAFYIAFFPQLIAGPIVRYQTVADQIENRKESLDDFCCGLQRFIVGLAKKMLIANNMAIIADAAFSSGSDLSMTMAWLGAIAYTFQIYFDFSAYSDMAIGLGRMFGFKFLENFNYPYISRTITEFWRRWHMSLGTWFRDYVYIPLGGNRVSSRLHMIFNIFVVWLLTGIWHGANWTFITWGLLYFVLLMFEKIFNWDKYRYKLAHMSTMFFVVIGWVIFRSDCLSYAWYYISSMLGYHGVGGTDIRALFYLNNYFTVFILASVFSLPVLPWLKEKFAHLKYFQYTYNLILIILFLISLSFIFKEGHNPFIYSNF